LKVNEDFLPRTRTFGSATNQHKQQEDIGQRVRDVREDVVCGRISSSFIFSFLPFLFYFSLLPFT